MTSKILGTLGALAAAALFLPTPASACGGFVCDNPNGGGPTPVVQAGERVIFENREDGKIRAYVQIRYNQPGGPPIGFSWIVPVMNVPEIGIASAALFDALDNATAPQFRFLTPQGTSTGGGGGGGGCGASDASGAPLAGSAFAETDRSGVMVWEEERVGDYETAVISSDDPMQLIEWLTTRDYDIPDGAEDLIGAYVDEGHVFAAFRYAPLGPGTGTLTPITLTMLADKPCVPIRITAIASTPILDVMVMALGPNRAAPYGPYVEATPDYDAIRQDFGSPTQTTYQLEVDRAIGAAGDHAWVVEYASRSAELLASIADTTENQEARALLARNPYLTRFYTRYRPETMTIDPEFVFEGGSDVSNFHVIDLTDTRFAEADTDPSNAIRIASAPTVVIAVGLALLWRRRKYNL